VYVVSEDRTVAVRPITVGVTLGEDTSVNSGLAPHELVVVDGTEKLREGSKVDVRNQNEKPAQVKEPPAAGFSAPEKRP
jgi:multidrug efflux system membrane fusion protein